MYDFSKLDDTLHMLEWLSPRPYDAMVIEIENSLISQIPDAKLDLFTVSEEPEWLTGAIPDENNAGKVILVRTAVAIPFMMTVSTDKSDSAGEAFAVGGVLSWACVNLNDQSLRKTHFWIDLGGSMKNFGAEGQLAERIYFEH